MARKSPIQNPVTDTIPTKVYKELDINHLNQTRAAELLGVSARDIRDYGLKYGMPFYTDEKGISFYVWSEIFPWYLAFFQEHKAKGTHAKVAREYTKQDITQLEAEILNIKKEQEQLKLEKTKSLLVDSKYIEDKLTTAVTLLRDRLGKLPRQLAKKVISGMELEQKEGAISQEINTTLKDFQKDIENILDGEAE